VNITEHDNPREHLAHVAPFKYNLVQVNTCSTDLTKWKSKNGVSAMVHHLVNPSDTHSNQYDSDSSSFNYTLNPLSYAHIAQTGSLDTVTENTASNQEDK
jgi:hypothetical protein